MADVRVTRGAVAPDEYAVRAALARDGLRAEAWSNAAGDAYAAHLHAYHKVLYCLRGSISFRIEPGGPEYVLGPGDRLDLPPGTRHSAVVGPYGVACIEGAAPARPQQRA